MPTEFIISMLSSFALISPFNQRSIPKKFQPHSSVKLSNCIPAYNPFSQNYSEKGNLTLLCVMSVFSVIQRRVATRLHTRRFHVLFGTNSNKKLIAFSAGEAHTPPSMCVFSEQADVFFLFFFTVIAKVLFLSPPLTQVSAGSPGDADGENLMFATFPVCVCMCVSGFSLLFVFTLVRWIKSICNNYQLVARTLQVHHGFNSLQCC